jgi:hypothetical protein
MKNLIPIIAFCCLLLFSCQGNTPKEKKNKTVTNEWISLFDGETLYGWHQYNGSALGEEWSVIDNTLVFDPSKKRNYGDGGKNIVTDREFTSFILSIEWKVAKAGNSGLFWAVQEGEEFGEPYLTGPEIQILDNERHPDALANPKYHQAGALYDMVQPTADVCKPAGEWNHVVLTVDHNNNKGNVILNGTEIIQFPVHGPEWEALIAASKFGDTSLPHYTHAPKFGQFKTGKIGLQDHGDKVAFRNIKIKEL